MPDTTPDNHVETLFEPDGQGTLMTMRMTLPDAATREAMLATGMDDGMEAELPAPGESDLRRRAQSRCGIGRRHQTGSQVIPLRRAFAIQSERLT